MAEDAADESLNLGSPYRDRHRPGYTQPNRADLVGLVAYVQPQLRAQINALARAAGRTTQEFMTELSENAVKAAKQDPKLAKVLRDQAKLERQQSETAARLVKLNVLNPG